MTIATLIAAERLDERLLDAALYRVPGGRLSAWVDEGHAADLASDADAADVRAALEGWEGVDIFVQPPGPRLRKLFVADMDSTMIGQECIDELADYAGVKGEVADVTERAMRGELDFREALAARVALLKGISRDEVKKCLDDRIQPNPGAATLTATLVSHGVRTLLVSGGFTDFVVPIGERLGFDHMVANVLGYEADRLTGVTVGPVVDATTKRDVAAAHLEELGLASDALLAIGDGANDSKMVELAGLGVAYRAKPALVAVSDARLDYHGLDALLWAQGIPRAQWTVRAD